MEASQDYKKPNVMRITLSDMNRNLVRWSVSERFHTAAVVVVLRPEIASQVLLLLLLLPLPVLSCCLS